MTRVSRLLAPVFAALILGLGVPASAQGPLPGRGPFLLTLIPSLGVVTWRCGAKPDSYGLGFRAFAGGATTDVGLSGRPYARVQPGRAVTLPLRGLRQTLRVRQFTKPGTVHATVVVRFEQQPVASHCYGYSPPTLLLRSTRRH